MGQSADALNPGRDAAGVAPCRLQSRATTAALPRMPCAADAIGVVVIGRNEGRRLQTCLLGLGKAGVPVVYVDSGSSDGSVAFARAQGMRVVELDLSTPFTAARARNVGRAALRDVAPGVAFVQFVDGDCELAPGWLHSAFQFLCSHPAHAVVFGRLRERHPEASRYNRLCDIEWDGPPGDTPSCGGVAMVRACAFDAMNGFREALIAGEEPELCLRLRRADWLVRRLAVDMAWHDAAMLRFTQWWRRSRRAGFAFAQGARLHGMGRDHHWVKETVRAIVWGGLLPTGIGLACLWSWPLAAVLALSYPLQWVRLLHRSPEGAPAALWAFFTLLGKFAEFAGVVQFAARSAFDSPVRLIEYK